LLDIEFMCLADKERLCFLLLLAFAGVSANKIPDCSNHIMHLCQMDEEPDIKLMIERGLLESWDAAKHQQMLDEHEESLRNNRDRQRRFRNKQSRNASVTRDKQSFNAMSRVETETETDTETRSKHSRSNAALFDRWWNQYPKKVGRKKALEIWKRRKLDTLADVIIADTLKRQTADDKWRQGFIPNPTTYLNGDRWEDAYETPQPRAGPTAVRESPPERRAREADEYRRSILENRATARTGDDDLVAAAV
jgi:hypothetical protein